MKILKNRLLSKIEKVQRYLRQTPLNTLLKDGNSRCPGGERGKGTDKKWSTKCNRQERKSGKGRNSQCKNMVGIQMNEVTRNCWKNGERLLRSIALIIISLRLEQGKTASGDEHNYQDKPNKNASGLIRVLQKAHTKMGLNIQIFDQEECLCERK